jgi:hypothetical protein
MASSSSSTGIRLSTGPKISSCAMASALFTLANSVGSMK